MTQNTLKVKDYVNLYAHDARKMAGPFTGIYEWTIPASYYSNRQSSVCTVSLVGASVQTKTNHGGGLVVSYHNGAQNSFDPRVSKHARDLAVVSYLQSIPSKNSAVATPEDPNPDNSNTHFYTDREQIKLLVSARPERIVLEFMESGVVNAKEILHGVITLCFEYYDSVETSKQYHEEFTRTL
jgi:hypothetical protein